MSKKNKYKIVIVDASPIIREGLKNILETDPAIEVPYMFSELNLLEKFAFNFKIDAFLINPALLDFSKRFALHQSLSLDHAIPCIAIINQYIEKGVLKQFDASIELYDQEERIRKTVVEALEKNPSSDEKVKDHGLSDREKEILISVAQGLSNKEIADKHHISVNTVITHRKNITQKTQIKTVAGLTMFAMLNNLIQL